MRARERRGCDRSVRPHRRRGSPTAGAAADDHDSAYAGARSASRTEAETETET